MYSCNFCGANFYHQPALAKHLAICMFANSPYFPAPQLEVVEDPQDQLVGRVIATAVS